MGFNTLDFGWHNECYKLRDVKIISKLELQQPDKDGVLLERSPPFNLFKTDEEKNKKIEEYENFDEVAYSNHEKIVTAKATVDDDFHQKLILGIPENKEHEYEFERESNIESFDFRIQEARTDDLVEAVKSGYFDYLAYDAEMSFGGYPYAVFFVTSDVFNRIEKLLDQPNVDLQVDINRKGWSWLGPIGDTVTYLNNTGSTFLNRENREMAELASITAIRKSNELEDKELLTEEEQEELLELPPNSVKANMHIFGRLAELSTQLTSIKSAVWIMAFGIVYLAYTSSPYY